MEQQGYDSFPGPAQGAFLDGTVPDGGRDADGARDRAPGSHADWRGELRRAILSRVVPRLSEIGREPDASPDGGRGAAGFDGAQVAAFSDMVLAAGVPGLVRHVDALRSDGLPIEAVVSRLLAPAARRLGDLWLEDRLSFLDVTAGLGRLQGVMRALGPDFEGEAGAHRHGKKVLLAPVPGEQHVFGVSVVASFFRRAGWDVTFEPRIAFADLVELARAERYAAIGLSASNDRLLPALPGQIEALRRASLNPCAALLAGGPAFLLDPGLRERVGADAVARDAAEAVRIAEALSAQTGAARAA